MTDRSRVETGSRTEPDAFVVRPQLSDDTPLSDAGLMHLVTCRGSPISMSATPKSPAPAWKNSKSHGTQDHDYGKRERVSDANEPFRCTFDLLAASVARHRSDLALLLA